MAPPKKKSPNGSKTFPIVISLVVVAMVGIVVLSITSTKKEEKALSKQEVSQTATLSAVTIDGKLGESTLPALKDGEADAALGKIVPKIVGEDFVGKTVTVTPGKKPYAIALLAHWCIHCRAEVPIIVKLHKDGKLPKDVEFVAITTSNREDQVNYPPSQWLLKEDWPFRKMADDANGTILTGLGGSGFPYVIYVNADGTVANRTSGERGEAEILQNANAISQEKNS